MVKRLNISIPDDLAARLELYRQRGKSINASAIRLRATDRGRRPTMMTCPLRDDCWREALARDGSGARVREVPATVTRPTPCNFERLGLVNGCPRARQRGGAATAMTPNAAPEASYAPAPG